MNVLKYGNITSNTPKQSVSAFVSGPGSQMNPSINLMVRLVIVFNVMRTNLDLISNIFPDVREEILEFLVPFIDLHKPFII